MTSREAHELLELVDRVEDRELGDAIAVGVDRLLLRWAPPGVVDELYPNERVDRALEAAS